MEPNKNIRVSRVELAQYQPVASSEKIERSGWLSFGDDNLYPTYLKELADTSPVHGAIVKGVARMIAGKGFAPLPTYNTDRLSRILPSVASDMSLYGGFYVECIKALGSDEVVKVTHLPFENCRLAVDENSNVTGIYYSKNWAQYRKKINEPVHIPLNSGEVKRFVKISFLDETTSVYYPQPSYKSCINYIELDRQISVFHVSNILNNFAPGTIVSLFNGTPDEDAKQAMKRELQGATGASNAGKMVVLFNEPDQQKPDIVTYQLNDADKQYDLLNRTATEKILVGHLITTPLLFGIKYGGDGFSSNADEMRQGLEIFMANVIEPMQRVIIDSLEEALNISGLVIIPNNILGATEVKPTEPVAPVAPVLKQHANLSAKMDMTEEQEVAWLNYLQDKGEVIDMELYDLVNEEVVEGEPVADEELSAVKLFKRFADPDAKSKNDAGLIKVRYRYSTALSDNSRIFCKNMVAASKAGVVYRYEDIIRMGDDGINSEFAAKGESTYSIFLYKGGANCHHFWTRQTFMRKRENGKFLPNKGLENDERISQASAEKKGFEFKDAQYWAEASTRPIDMPNNGYKNPRP
jgi:hypothetical protein